MLAAIEAKELSADEVGQSLGVDLITLEAMTAWLEPQRSPKGRELGVVGIGGLRAYWRRTDFEKGVSEDHSASHPANQTSLTKREKRAFGWWKDIQQLRKTYPDDTFARFVEREKAIAKTKNRSTDPPKMNRNSVRKELAWFEKRFSPPVTLDNAWRPVARRAGSRNSG